MSNVFISYAKEDAAAARMLADALQKAEFSVWWDRLIPPGRTWDDVIGRALDTAACVVVLWSRASIQSRWVREEAEKAASRGCLIPVLVDKVDPPFGFGRIQAADLSGWRGDEHDPRFADLLRAVSDLVQTTPDRSAADQPVSQSVKPAPEPHNRGSRFQWIAGGVIAVAVTFYVASQFSRAPRPEPQAATVNPAPVNPAPVKSSPPATVGRRHEGCEKFADLEAVVSRGPITRIAVYHDGYVHGIRIRYGTDGLGETHGFTQWRDIRLTEWDVPDGERITHVEGVIAPPTSGRAGAGYVSRLQFFTDGGKRSPLFGTSGGEPFVVTDSAKGGLRTISGWANLKRSGSFNRAVASMTFQFCAPY